MSTFFDLNIFNQYVKMAEIICLHCNTSFKTNSALLRHQQTAKYCLKIRGESSQESYTCKVCNHNFTRKNGYQQHITKCKPIRRIEILENQNKELVYKNKALENLIDNYKHQIKDLQDKLEYIAIRGVEKPTNQTINLLPITEEYMKNCAQYLTIEHIKDGPIGYAKYALEYPFKDRILCVDYARKKIKYKNNNGEYIIDPYMVKLAPRFFKCIEDHNDQLIDEYVNELKQQCDVLCDQVVEGWAQQDRDDEIVKLNDIIGLLKSYKGSVKRSITHENQMKAEFVNHITKTTHTSIYP